VRKRINLYGTSRRGHLIPSGNVVNTVPMPVVTIGPRQQLSYDNVLQSLFGQSIGVFGPIRFQTTGTLVQLAANSDSATGYRSNLDFMNPGAAVANVTATIRRGDGTHLSNGTFSVGPNGLVQKKIDDGGTFPGVAGTTDTNLWMEFTSDQPILVFASVINNGSGDPFAVEMSPEPAVATIAPVTSFSVSTNPTMGFPVTFSDTSRNSPLYGFWAFGDGQYFQGSYSPGSVVVHTYASAGTYHAALFVVNAGGSNTLFTDVVVATPTGGNPNPGYP
jgi:PKD repeat protein